jgi:ATP-binding cassette subfamily B protein
MSKLARLLPYALRQKTWLAAILGATLATSLVTVLEPWPVKVLVDFALGDEPVPATLVRALALVGADPTPRALVAVAAALSLALYLTGAALGAALNMSWTIAGQRMVYDLGGDMFHRLQRLPQRFHARQPVGDSLSRISTDSYALYRLTDGALFTPLRCVFVLVAVGSFAWRLDRQLTIVSMLVAPVLGASAWFFGPRLKRLSRERREGESRLMSFVHQSLTGIPVVQAFGTAERNVQEFTRLGADIVLRTQRGNLVRSGYSLANGLVNVCGAAFVLYVGGGRVLAGTMPLGTLLVFLAYLKTLQGACKGLLGIYGSLKIAEASVDRVLEVLDARDELRVAAEPRTQRAAHATERHALPAPRRGESGHVRLERVTFGYEPGRPVLTDVSLEARPGDVVALVGRTGSGKSTLVGLVPRFFDPWDGRVLLDGHDVRSLALDDVRGRVAVLFQEPFLLPLSVADNIAYGRPDASREEIVAAAIAARADEFVRRLPAGYDTVLGEKGATLSGGQRQRLAIARALLVDAPVLILDEPTAALDAQTEVELMQALERLMEGRTTIIVAHRLATIRRADRIVVLAGGRVVEEGTHEELVRRGGRYARLTAEGSTESTR